MFGKPTIEDVRHLMRVVEFRIDQGDKIASQISDSWKASNTAKYEDLAKDWMAFKTRWAKARKEVLDNILVLNLAAPLTPASLIVDSADYTLVKFAIDKTGDDSYEKGDLSDVLLRLEAAAGVNIDSTNQPVPDGWDPDLAVYKKTDEAIKSGEAAAVAAADAAAKAAKSNVGLLIIGGVVIVGGIVVATKVYL